MCKVGEYSTPELLAELEEILAEFAATELAFARELSQLHENFRKSAAKLIQYLTLRPRDIHDFRE